MNEGLLFRVITGQTDQMIRVCRLPALHQGALGAYTGVVWLSPETCRKTETKHHHPQMELYRKAPTIIQCGLARILDPMRLVYIHEFTDEPGKLYRAVVKRTKDGRELYLVSVHRMRIKQVRKTLAMTKPII